MKSRKVRLENAYLNGQLGFRYYLDGRSEVDQTEDFYKVLIRNYNDISVDGLAPEEIMFYITGFIDDYSKEKSRRKEANEEDLKLEEEDWFREVLEKNKVETVEELGPRIIDSIMARIEDIYKNPEDIITFLNTRLKYQSSYLVKEYEDFQREKFVKLKAKERRIGKNIN